MPPSSPLPSLEQYGIYKVWISPDVHRKFMHVSPNFLKDIAKIEMGSRYNSESDGEEARMQLLKKMWERDLTGHFNEVLSEMLQLYTLPPNAKIIPECRYFQSKISNRLLIWGQRLHSDVIKAICDKHFRGEPYSGLELIVKLGDYDYIHPVNPNETEFEAFLKREGFGDVVKNKDW